MTTHFKGSLVAADGFKVGDASTSYDITDNVANKSTSTITVGAEAANVINVAVQLNDAKGDALTEAGFVDIYLSSDAAGQAVAGTAMDTLAVGTDGTILVALTAGLYIRCVTEADGDLDLNLTYDNAAAYSVYAQVVFPDGRIKASSIITFAAE